jgi:hypothetical protein
MIFVWGHNPLRALPLTLKGGGGFTVLSPPPLRARGRVGGDPTKTFPRIH